MKRTIAAVIFSSVLLAGCSHLPKAQSIPSNVPQAVNPQLEAVEAADSPEAAIEAATKEMDKSNDELEIPAADELSDTQLGV
jgi:outer membrane murein-binding lipoprotein Lpp